MANILGIMGSPRKGGNTDVLLGHLLDGARHAGAETSVVRLADLTIGECTGCFACWKLGACVQQDDMLGLYGRIAAADVLVFATPVYWYGPTALMKAMLDRFVFFNDPKTRTQVRGKRAAILVPLEESVEAADPLVAMFEKSFRYLEMEFAGRLIVPGVFHRNDAIAKPESLEAARALGRSLAG